MVKSLCNGTRWKVARQETLQAKKIRRTINALFSRLRETTIPRWGSATSAEADYMAKGWKEDSRCQVQKQSVIPRHDISWNRKHSQPQSGITRKKKDFESKNCKYWFSSAVVFINELIITACSQVWGKRLSCTAWIICMLWLTQASSIKRQIMFQSMLSTSNRVHIPHNYWLILDCFRVKL